MKRTIVFFVTLTLMGFMIPLQSSQAIFGFSKCEKVLSVMKSEEKIATKLQGNFQRNFLKFRGLPNSSKLFEIAIKSKIKLIKQDLRIGQIATNVSTCFNQSQRMFLRQFMANRSEMLQGAENFYSLGLNMNWTESGYGSYVPLTLSLRDYRN
jgi:hypothetical protein